MNQRILPSIAVIVPMARGENAWPCLLSDLSNLPDSVQVVLVAVQPLTPAQKRQLSEICPRKKVSWIIEHPGRAKQMNAGARFASADYLWFLHADSRVEMAQYQALLRSILKRPAQLHYFNLGFLPDGPCLTRLNGLGVWLRSHFLGIPFGDQGFCIGREQFFKLEGFDESLSGGEDHALVWRARFLGIGTCCTGSKIFTSARKYKENGWLRVTLKHISATFRQALSEIQRATELRNASQTPPK